MSFCSQQYIVFFLIVFSLYWTLQRNELRVYCLLVASFIFYAWWNPWLALLVIGTTVMDYLLARGMSQSTVPRTRRILMLTSLIVNLGVLCTFKYLNFFLDSLEKALLAAGAETSFPVLKVIVPFGISFYTFEAISYTLDVYRRRIEAEKNLAYFMLFILFFPHLVAGPIVRAYDFLPQVRRPKQFSWLQFRWGFELFLLGLFKKLAIADRMAYYADPIFAQPGQATTGMCWMAAIAYSVQIYCDFSGYSDMALGTARMFGYKLTWNFNLPYIARNVSEFWRRWHISLSTWLRDYLFIPLGGSRGGFWYTARNLMITMTLGGFWHGASWNFVVWGIAHGTLLIGHRLFAAFCAPRPRLQRILETSLGIALRVFLTYMVVTLCWILFRASSFEVGWTFLRKMFEFHSWGANRTMTFQVTVAFLSLGLGAWLGRQAAIRRMLLHCPGWLLGILYALAFSLALLLAAPEGQAFIYFQF